jgi:metalloendopeptidase OMA1, mitochondrial
VPIAKNEDGLACILGHEMAHFVLKHPAEKLSGSQLFSFLGISLAWFFGVPLDVILPVNQLLFELPNSRTLESEGFLFYLFS